MTANKILCIEDEADIRQIIVEELNDAGYETVEADNGKTGLAAIVANHPDLVLCDMNMPEMDGNQLLQTLRADHPELADMPFVFLTAQTDRNSMLNGRKLGADDYLTKPIDFELLLVTLEARLGQVHRIEAKQEQQLVKLYKTVSGGTAVPAAADTVKTQSDTAAPRTPSGVPPEKRKKLAEASSDNNGRITAGRLQFIGLDVIRDELGDRWPAFADRVFDIAEKTISRRIAERDVYNRDENDNFVICFAELGEAEASFKADRIAEEIRQKILGAGEIAIGETPAAPSGSRQAAAHEANSIAVRTSHALSADAHSIELTLEEIDNTESVFDLVMTRLDQAAGLNRQAEQATLREVFESCQIRMRSVELRESSRAPFSLADFDDRTQLKIGALTRNKPCSDELAAEIDILRLAQVAQRLYANPTATESVVIVDLRFTTLEYRRHQERLVKILRSLQEPVPSSIAFKLSGVPEGIYPSRMTDLANILRPFCRLIMIELSGPSLDRIDPLSARVPVITCGFTDISQTLAKSPEKIRRLIHEVHEKKARILVHSIPDLENKMLLTNLGTDLLATS